MTECTTVTTIEDLIFKEYEVNLLTFILADLQRFLSDEFKVLRCFLLDSKMPLTSTEVNEK